MTTDARPSNADLAAIKERLSATTPPPWHRTDSPTPADVTFVLATRTDVPALIAKVEELRAVLEPLIAEPWIPSSTDDDATNCMHCHYINGRGINHAAHCPVLKADALLGKS